MGLIVAHCRCPRGHACVARHVEKPSVGLMSECFPTGRTRGCAETVCAGFIRREERPRAEDDSRVRVWHAHTKSEGGSRQEYHVETTPGGCRRGACGRSGVGGTRIGCVDGACVDVLSRLTHAVIRHSQGPCVPMGFCFDSVAVPPMLLERVYDITTARGRGLVERAAKKTTCRHRRMWMCR